MAWREFTRILRNLSEFQRILDIRAFDAIIREPDVIYIVNGIYGIEIQVSPGLNASITQYIQNLILFRNSMEYKPLTKSGNNQIEDLTFFQKMINKRELLGKQKGKLIGRFLKFLKELYHLLRSEMFNPDIFGSTGMDTDGLRRYILNANGLRRIRRLAYNDAAGWNRFVNQINAFNLKELIAVLRCFMSMGTQRREKWDKMGSGAGCPIRILGITKGLILKKFYAYLAFRNNPNQRKGDAGYITMVNVNPKKVGFVKYP